MYIDEFSINLTGREAFTVWDAAKTMEMDESLLIAGAINNVIQVRRPGANITNPENPGYSPHLRAEFLREAARHHFVGLPFSSDLAHICIELLQQESAFVQMTEKPRSAVVRNSASTVLYRHRHQQEPIS